MFAGSAHSTRLLLPFPPSFPLSLFNYENQGTHNSHDSCDYIQT